MAKMCVRFRGFDDDLSPQDDDTYEVTVTFRRSLANDREFAEAEREKNQLPPATIFAKPMHPRSNARDLAEGLMYQIRDELRVAVGESPQGCVAGEFTVVSVTIPLERKESKYA